MKCIAVTSGKGGTGKSCVAAYTAAALASRGCRTLVVELGWAFKSIDLILGVQEGAVFDVTDVLEGRCEPETAIVPVPGHDNLFFLPAGLHPAGFAGREAVKALLHAFRLEYDYVLVDGVDFAQFSPALFDMVLMVLTPDSLSIRACAQHAADLYANGARNLRLVINNVPPQVLPMYGAQDFDDVIDLVGVQLIAVVPASPKLQYAANNGRELDAESITGDVFGNLAERLRGKCPPLLIR